MGAASAAPWNAASAARGANQLRDRKVFINFFAEGGGRIKWRRSTNLRAGELTGRCDGFGKELSSGSDFFVGWGFKDDGGLGRVRPGRAEVWQSRGGEVNPELGMCKNFLL